MLSGKITTAKDFKKLYNSSNKIVNKGFVFLFTVDKSTPVGSCSTGVVASKKVGNAVARNFCKRRLRSMIKESLKQYSFSYQVEIVTIARKKMLYDKYDSLVHEMYKSLDKVNELCLLQGG